MKIALCGSAPSSCRNAPFGDSSWEIWGCSPGLYPYATRIDAWFELHRWEPPVIGKADKQVPWFSPEYCAWMAGLPCTVWTNGKVDDLPNSRPLPVDDLVHKYGHFVFTSSLSWMMAMAMEKIIAARKGREAPEEDWIGLWGVDMAANEELYSGQRAACQFFVQMAASIDIRVYTPPESDLMTPPPLYGISESSHRAIKWLARRNELQARKQGHESAINLHTAQLHYVNGALDDLDYMQKMWLHEGEIYGTRFEDIFGKNDNPRRDDGAGSG